MGATTTPEEFYEALNSAVPPQAKLRAYLESMHVSSLATLAFNLERVSPHSHDVAPDSMSFQANATLSGYSFPCGDPDCRLERVRSGSRFAALYADSVGIRDPFEPFHRIGTVDEARHPILVRDLYAAISIMRYLRPLIEAKIVRIHSQSMHLCADCLSNATGHSRDDFEIHLDRIRASVEMALRRLDWQVARTLNEVTVSLPSATSLGHHSLHAGITSPDVLKGSNEYALAVVFRSVAEEIVRDLANEHLYSQALGTNYLTDRALDLECTESLRDQVNHPTAGMIDGFAHSLPFLDEISLERIVELRKSDGGAFDIYRRAIRQVLSEADVRSPQSVREAVVDIIEPEIARMNQTIKSARKLLVPGLISDLAFASVSLAAGIAVGTIAPTVGAAIAITAGGKNLRDAMEKVHGLVRAPQSVSNERFYFLWKAKMASAPSHEPRRMKRRNE